MGLLLTLHYLPDCTFYHFYLFLLLQLHGLYDILKNQQAYKDFATALEALYILTFF
jgi:hypothetical protein